MATIIISTVLALFAAAVIAHMVKQKKSGKTACGCGCGTCPSGGKCHERKQ